MTWREIASPIIYNVLLENKGKSEKEIKQALFDAYPFGERAMHPYKVWLSEIRNQLKKPKKQSENINQVKLDL